MKIYKLKDIHTWFIKKSKFGSGRSERLEIIFFRQVGHSLLPLIKAVVIHSEQKRCKHSFVVIVNVKRSRQIGQQSSADKVREVTLIFVSSVINLCGLRT